MCENRQTNTLTNGGKYGVYSRGLFYTRRPFLQPRSTNRRGRKSLSAKVFMMRFHTGLFAPLLVVPVVLNMALPQCQQAARAEESELVLKTAGEEAKPETKDAKPELVKEPVKSDSGGGA